MLKTNVIVQPQDRFGKQRRLRLHVGLYKNGTIGMTLHDEDSGIPYGAITDCFPTVKPNRRVFIRDDSVNRQIAVELIAAGVIGSPDMEIITPAGKPYLVYTFTMKEEDTQ